MDQSFSSKCKAAELNFLAHKRERSKNNFIGYEL